VRDRERLDDVLVVPPTGEELADRNVPIAIEPCLTLPAGEFFEVRAVLGFEVTVGTNRVLPSSLARNGTINRSLYQLWPIPPGFVVE
jgi:hypothetical protein